jgi:hypothetical protein
MLRYDVVVGASNHEEQRLARQWLLDYNRGDGPGHGNGPHVAGPPGQGHPEHRLGRSGHNPTRTGR